MTMASSLLCDINTVMTVSNHSNEHCDIRHHVDDACDDDDDSEHDYHNNTDCSKHSSSISTKVPLHHGIPSVTTLPVADTTSASDDVADCSNKEQTTTTTTKTTLEDSFHVFEDEVQQQDHHQQQHQHQHQHQQHRRRSVSSFATTITPDNSDHHHQQQQQQPQHFQQRYRSQHSSSTTSFEGVGEGDDVDLDCCSSVSNSHCFNQDYLDRSFLTHQSEATTRASSDDFIHKKLSSYGIVPLTKKKHVAFERTLKNNSNNDPNSSQSALKRTIEEVHKWLFVDGGPDCEDVEAFIKGYGHLVRKLGVPVDRVYYGGIGLHPKLTAFQWIWEPDCPHNVRFSEMPPHIFARRNELFSPDEPLCILEQGRADFVRVRNTDSYIAPELKKWFLAGNYTDYYALPDIYRNQSKGGLCWATKHVDGFSDDDIHLFNVTLQALTNILRLHTNDLVLTTLSERMEQEIRERTQQLAEANHELANANQRLEIQRKKQLEHFACMSHEIRTPLNCIVGLSSVLLESPEELTPGTQDSVQMIKNSADLLHGVVDDVLDYSKMESGVFEVDIRSTNLQDTLMSVVHAMQEKAIQRQVKIRTSYGPSLPEFVETDPRRIQQVMYNLLGNACKFSKRGGIVDLSVSLEEKSIKGKQEEEDTADTTPEEQHTHILKFAVKDYGKGIDQKDFESVFKPFNQASKETHTNYGGTGLGLSIASKLVERLGGKISVDSKLGEYAEFVVELPFRGKPVNIHEVVSSLQGNNEGVYDDGSNNNNKNVTIILLKNDDETHTNHPFGPETIEEYHIDFIECTSWKEIRQIVPSSPSIKDSKDNMTQQHQGSNKSKRYVLIVPSNRKDPIAMKMFSKKVKDCLRVITYGHHHCNVSDRQRMMTTPIAAHWTSLSKKFPAVAMQSIASLFQKKQKTVDDSTIQQQEETYMKIPHNLSSNLQSDLFSIDGCDHADNSGKTTSRHLEIHPTDIQCPRNNGSGGLFSPISNVSVKKSMALKQSGNTTGLFAPLSSNCNSDPPKVITIRPNSNAHTISKRAVTKPSLASNISKSKNKETGASSSSQVIEAGAAEATDPSTLKVLYAEDNKINQKVFGRMLTKLGVKDVTIVENGQLAVEASAQNAYDIIFMDIQMPVLDGLEATKIIKDRDGDKAKIVFCTAHVLDDFRMQCDEVNADGFVSKPFNLKRIKGLLNEYAEKKRSTI